jgi:hypothetical protein
MSAILLIPGPGGKYTSEAISSATTGADTLGCTRCSGLDVQQILVGASSLGGNFQLEETVDGTNYVILGSTVNIADHQITKYEAASRPFGRIRINAANVTGLDSTHTLQLQILGSAFRSV